MRRLTPTGRPSRLVLALLAASILALLAGIALHGTPGQTVRHHPREVVTYPTHAVDYLKAALMYGGGILFLAATVRWYAANEPTPAAEEARRGFGDSITDVRTDQDPAVGMLPVRTPER